MSASSQAVLVVGATSPIGRALALESGSLGHPVFLAGRNRDELERLARDFEVRTQCPALALEVDFEDPESRAAFLPKIQAALAESSLRLAGAYLTVGTMAPDEVEARMDPRAIARLYQVNLVAVVEVLEGLARELEGQGSGFLSVLSSVAGDRGRQSNYLYGSAKAGLTTYLAGLRHRLFPQGVTVTTVKPGFVDTSMTFGKVDSPLTASPKAVARTIVAATRRGKSEVYAPWFWGWIMTIIRWLPEAIFHRSKL